LDPNRKERRQRLGGARSSQNPGGVREKKALGEKSTKGGGGLGLGILHTLTEKITFEKRQRLPYKIVKTETGRT